MRKRTGVLGWLLVGLLCIMAAGCSGPVQAPVSESQRIIQEQTENMEETEHRPVVIETEPEPETEAQELSDRRTGSCRAGKTQTFGCYDEQ